jgi:hypothetical protein
MVVIRVIVMQGLAAVKKMSQDINRKKYYQLVALFS